MRNEREYLARLESANTEELARMVAAPTTEEEEVLRTHLGDVCFQRMHALAIRAAEGTERGILDWFGGKPPQATDLGNVVVLPGLMGSELTTRDLSGDADTIWLNIPRIVLGRLERLRMAADGRTENDLRYRVHPTGILKRYYGQLMLSLARRWNTKAFWYDWRKDLDTAADSLLASINQWFSPDAPVHLVAHSMGGLVARTFIKRHPERWKSMWDPGDAKAKTKIAPGARGGRLVMLGTPNHGSYLIPQAATGLAETIQLIERVDPWHGMDAILEITNSFVGPFQLLPSLEVDKDALPLYDPATYGAHKVSSAFLKKAKDHHKSLKGVIDKQRMLYVAGADQPTYDGISDMRKIDDLAAYQATRRGDGSVSHRLGLLRDVVTYFVRSEHSALTSNPQVLASLDELLRDGRTMTLAGGQPVARQGEIPALRGEGETDAEKKKAAEWLLQKRASNDERIRDLARQIRARGFSRRARGGTDAVQDDSGATGVAVEATPLTRMEREAADLIVGTFLNPGDDLSGVAAAPFGESPRTAIVVRLVHGSIGELDDFEDGERPIDAIAVGHYIGVRPQAAERVLDEAISGSIFGPIGGDDANHLLLTQFTDRGVISGELGQSFFLPDPRRPDQRLIALAGMGEVGRCGAPELSVLVRELSWSLGRLGRKHLATVLIGSGHGNLTVRDAVESWFRGLRNALRDTSSQNAPRIERVTFVEHDPLRLHEIQEAIISAAAEMRRRCQFDITFVTIPEAELSVLEHAGLERRAERMREDLERQHRESRRQFDIDLPPTRLTVGIERDPRDPHRAKYRFGAITAVASIPERVVELDPVLVARANDELAGESRPELQRERGEFLGRLLIPRELRSHISTPAPLVVLLDSDTARVHWEMVAQPDPIRDRDRNRQRGQADDSDATETEGFDTGFFLGTSRSLTRQLRTSFAGPPEPPPPQNRILRVLIVADPAEDAHLPGAEAEGTAVLDLFETFNAIAAASGSPNRVEVVPLLGPHQARRTNVLRELTARSYDLVHYAGHAFYNEEIPARSGWLFSNGEVISAHELQRIDRVPGFIFANACQSGITPDRAGQRAADLAPSFAESFFERGVKNFVCTAWPVDDLAAQLFALTLYRNLLGLPVPGDTDADGNIGTGSPGPARYQPMHIAMREARRQVARHISGRQTWGAYQHYGNPFHRVFAPATP